MKRLLIALVVVLSLGSLAQAVPYPYREYKLETTGDLQQIYYDRQDLYTVYVKSEAGRLYPWDEGSRARIKALDVIEAEVNYRANHEFWSEAKKAEEMNQRKLIFADSTIEIEVMLETNPSVDHGYRYIELESGLSYISRVVLEVDDGRLVEPLHIYSGDSSVIGSRWWNFNSVTFPRYDDDGVPVIRKETKWIKLWVISSSDRVFFQFDFEH